LAFPTISSSSWGMGSEGSGIRWEDVFSTMANSAPSTIVGLRAVGPTQSFSMYTRGKRFSMTTAHITESSKLPQGFHARSSNSFENWTWKGKDDSHPGTLNVEASEPLSFRRCSVTDSDEHSALAWVESSCRLW